MSSVRAVTIRDCAIGGPELVVMGGPCAIESREQILQAAEVVASSGARFLRGGAFKVRTSPTAFQGLGWDGWKLLREAADAFSLLTVSEILDEGQIGEARRYVDFAQIGSRNMQNIPLLRALGRSRLPVMLKRGFGCTIDEWIHAAEYVLREGNEAVVMCERGIRTFETATRFTLDVAAVPIAKKRLACPCRRPFARRRPPRLGRVPDPGRGRRRRRRAARRDPPRPGEGPLRRAAGGAAHGVPRAHREGAPRRARDGPLDCTTRR
jgi:3-deoxy-7-phosphoheptulonate synthase